MLPCLGIPDPKVFPIVETDASDLGYEGTFQTKTLRKVKRACSQISFRNLAFFSTKIFYY